MTVAVANAPSESGINQPLDLKQFQRRVIVFLLTPLLLAVPWFPFGLMYGRHYLERAKGPTFSTQIDQAFENALARDYDMLFLGNSRIYRGLNPDQFDTSAFNFAHNDDTYNHVYHKLRWVLDRDIRIKTLVVGVDLFQFSYMASARNGPYSRYLGDEYLADYEEAPWADLELKVRLSVRGLNPKYFFMPENRSIYQRENGQFVKPGVAKPTDTAVRTTRRLPVQVEYFEKTLQLCREQGISVVLCMMPTRVEERNCYGGGEIEEFMAFIKQYVADDVKLIDHTYDDEFSIADYTDITHFNEAAADRFSIKFNEELRQVLDGRTGRDVPMNVAKNPDASGSR